MKVVLEKGGLRAAFYHILRPTKLVIACQAIAAKLFLPP